MPLKLYNTMSRKKEQFKPLHGSGARIYTCGLTVYDYAHIGNLRAYITWDLLKRILKMNSFKVKHVMNYTDVGHLVSDDDEGEDKMEKGARRERKTAWEIADFYIKAYDEDARKLGIVEPDFRPRATEHIKEMIEMIKVLEKKGFTYIIDDGVYFDTSKLSDYGKLARLNKEGLKAGIRVEMAEGKKNPTDFALWKFSPKDKKRDMEWDSPWGKGFPGWHLECSVMASKYLGETLDIHCGGVDHIPVHHTNEIAQSEAASGKKFSNMWVHNEFLVVDGKKMSKSLGNFYTLRDLEEKGFSPTAFRYLILSAHYRSKMNFTLESLKDSQNAVESMNNFFSRLDDSGKDAEENKKIFKELEKARKVFESSLNDDMNTPNALAAVFGLMKFVNKEIEAGKADRKSLEAVKKFMASFNEIFGIIDSNKEAVPSDILKLAEERERMRREKKFREADELRNEIRNKGYALEDSENGVKIKKIK